jgi:uncharacterized protein (TIGR03083 family)
MGGNLAREDFAHAAEYFVSTVEAVRDDQWEGDGLGEWTVRDLVGHTSRSFSTIGEYLERPAAEAELSSAADYFAAYVAAAAGPTMSAAAIAQRGRDAATALGDDPKAAVRAQQAEVLERLTHTADDELLTTLLGGMRLIDYLPTRTFELTVHTIDLARATGQPPAPPAGPARSTLLLTAELVARGGPAAAADALSALTGRQALPPGFTVL